MAALRLLRLFCFALFALSFASLCFCYAFALLSFSPLRSPPYLLYLLLLLATLRFFVI